jgi:hypothetical protein
MSRPAVVSILTDIVSRFDITAIQEVLSASPDPVDQYLALIPEKYGYVIGPREGRSSSREQYWIIYDTEKFIFLGAETWPDPYDKFERNPLGVYFKTVNGNFDFILINNHIRPSDAKAEIEALSEAAVWFRELWDERDVLIVGDFNADGFYYDESLLALVFPPDEYKSIIPNDADTSLAPSDNTYDRFIITASAFEDYAGSWGVMRFDEVYDFTGDTAAAEISDHYPVWADFFIDQDTD